MHINKITVKNFRNYSAQEMAFDNNINVLVGRNAQGKTNIMEAIYFGALGKSPRTKKESELISFNESHSEIKIELQKLGGTKHIEVYLNKGVKKSIKVNQINLMKIADLMGTLPIVYFAPEDLKLVKESPEDRRKFLDISLSQLSKKYFYLLLRYQKILDQRNKLLKSTQNLDVIRDTLPVWDDQLATVGSQIIYRRIKFINKLKTYASNKINILTDCEEEINLTYTGICAETESEIKELFYNFLQQNLDKDLRLGYTGFGPHRDDIKIELNNIDVREFGSQGQQRTTTLALKLSEVEIFKEEYNEYPILLLDDVMSELDQTRQNNLLKACHNIQTFITTTQINDYYKQHAKIFEINKGSAKLLDYKT